MTGPSNEDKHNSSTAIEPPETINTDHNRPYTHETASTPPPRRHHSPHIHTQQHRPHNSGFILHQRIGKGSFATVYKGEWGGKLFPQEQSLHHSTAGTPDKQTVAIKVVHQSRLKRDQRLMDIFEGEMAILKQMKHPHVVHLIDVIQTSTDYNLIMEYCSMGELSRFIRGRKKLIRDNEHAAALFERYPSPGPGMHPTIVRHILSQLASALAFLRDNHLVHRDLKPQNLLLKPPMATKEEAKQMGYIGRHDLPVVKVADFGFARFLPATSMAETMCGSPLYMAPEILNREKYNAMADLWSVGAVTYEMVVGKPPFPAANPLELIKMIDDNKSNIVLPEDVPADLSELIKGLLKRYPLERLSFHEFFRRTSPSFASADGNVQDAPDVKDDAATSPLDDVTYAHADIPIAPASTAPAATSPASTTRAATSPASTSPASTSPASTRASTTPASITPASTTPASTTPAYNTPAAATASTSDSPESYLEYLRRQGGQDVAVESPSPSPQSSQSHSHLIPRLSGQPPNSISSDGDSEVYVFIEKRTVEVNSLADDMQSPSVSRKLSNPEKKPRRRRLSSIAYGASPTNALAQALLKSSVRLFGPKPDSGTRSREGSMESLPRVHNSMSPNIHTSLSAMLASPKGGEKQVIDELEEFATIAKVVSLYADVKYSQLDVEPVEAYADSTRKHHYHTSGTSSASHYNHHPSGGRRATSSSLYPIHSPSQMDPYLQLKLASEALALHLKSLSILSRAMDCVSDWWEQEQKSHKKESSMTKSIPGINSLVQWVRDKFNECMDKAEIEKALVAKLSTEISSPPLEINAERLLFDRGLEMAKTAALQEVSVNESQGTSSKRDTIATSEINYGTAMWMLKALVATDSVGEELSEDDRVMVETLMAKIVDRLSSMRSKYTRSSQFGSSVVLSPKSTAESFMGSRDGSDTSRLTPP